MGEIVPNQLFVAVYSLNKIPNEKGIKEIFKKYGNIKEVAYKGSYSFVTFSLESEAQDAMKALNGQSNNGFKLKVDVVDNRKGRRNGPQESDECFKCGQGGHWARECKNKTSPRRKRYSDQRSRHRRSNSRSRSYSSYSSSYSRGRRDSKKRNRNSRRRSRSPRRDNKRKKSTSRKRSNTNSRSRSSVSNKQRQSHKTSTSK